MAYDCLDRDQLSLRPIDFCTPLEAQADLLREVAGNPFDPVVLPPACVLCGGLRFEPEAEHAACAACGNGMTGRQYVSPAVRSLALLAYRERPSPVCPACGGKRERHEKNHHGAWEITLCECCHGSGVLRLAAVADAMEEAGCYRRCSQKFHDVSPVKRVVCRECDDRLWVTHPLVAHLRSPGPHVRGCWALRAILGESILGSRHE